MLEWNGDVVQAKTDLSVERSYPRISDRLIFNNDDPEHEIFVSRRSISGDPRLQSGFYHDSSPNISRMRVQRTRRGERPLAPTPATRDAKSAIYPKSDSEIRQN